LQGCSDRKYRRSTGADAAHASQRRPDGLATLIETPTGHTAMLIKCKLEVAGIPCVISEAMVSGPRLNQDESFWQANRVLVPEMLLSQALVVVRSEVIQV
jgi:hypothetical protein